MTGRVGVAISTTGDEHRMGFLETAVLHWLRASDGFVVVTVDGSAQDAARVHERVGAAVDVYRVGRPLAHFVNMDGSPSSVVGTHELGRLGVATNKNTGIELLMDAGVEHLFLSDDDTWPLHAAALDKHISGPLHSQVNWGRHRLDYTQSGYSAWKWPRGSVMYVHRPVVEQVGGMDERFGPGGHEHVEWSNRIHNAGLTEEAFISPASYATRNGLGAAVMWHAEDMPRFNEKLGDHRLRRRKITSVRRADGDWEKINAIMAEREGSSDFVSYRAHENGRASATLCADLSGAEEPAEPRSNK